MSDFKYKRVLLKLSGEALMGSQSFGIDPAVPLRLAEEIRPVYEAGVEVAVVVGGGNIYRGVQGAANGMDRAQGDNMGMLATVINALALQDTFEKAGMDCRVMSAIEMRQIAEPYIRRRAIRHLEKGRITIFAAGTGNPYFTTDTGAALRACEINAEMPDEGHQRGRRLRLRPRARTRTPRSFDTITYSDVLNRDLKVMDATATALCRDNKHAHYGLRHQRAWLQFERAVSGQNVGTTVFEEEN